MIQIGPQPLDPGKRIADRAGERRLAGYFWKLGVQPCFQIIEDWFCFVLPDLTPFVRRLAPRLFLNDVKLGDAPYDLFCNGGALRFVYADELAADMRLRSV